MNNHLELVSGTSGLARYDHRCLNFLWISALSQFHLRVLADLVSTLRSYHDHRWNYRDLHAQQPHDIPTLPRRENLGNRATAREPDRHREQAFQAKTSPGGIQRPAYVFA